jgi:hypothetical protein
LFCLCLFVDLPVLPRATTATSCSTWRRSACWPECIASFAAVCQRVIPIPSCAAFARFCSTWSASTTTSCKTQNKKLCLMLLFFHIFFHILFFVTSFFFTFSFTSLLSNPYFLIYYFFTSSFTSLFFYFFFHILLTNPCFFIFFNFFFFTFLFLFFSHFLCLFSFVLFCCCSYRLSKLRESGQKAESKSGDIRRQRKLISQITSSMLAPSRSRLNVSEVPRLQIENKASN